LFPPFVALCFGKAKKMFLVRYPLGGKGMFDKTTIIDWSKTSPKYVTQI
jgi:hypothetical protein